MRTSLFTCLFTATFFCAFHGTKGQPSLFFPLEKEKIAYAEEVLQEARAKKDSLLYAEAYYLFGKAYNGSGDLFTANGWFLRSLQIQERRGPSFELSRLYVRLADIELAQLHEEEAHRLGHRALAMSNRLGSDKGLLAAYMVLGNIFSGYNQFNQIPGRKPLVKLDADSASFYYGLAMKLAQKNKIPSEVASVEVLLGNLYATQQSPKALIYLQSALHQFTKEKHTVNMIRAMQDMAAARMALSQPKMAAEILSRAEELYRKEKIENHSRRWRFEYLYSGLYQMTGDWEKAFMHEQESHRLLYNTYLNDRNAAIKRLTIEYETERQQARLNAQQRELGLREKSIRSQQMLIWTVGALLAIAALFSVFLFLLYQKKQKLSLRYAELLKEQNHRVKNNLQVISSMLNMQSNRLEDSRARQAVEESQLRVESMAILHRRLYDGVQLSHIAIDDFIRELVEQVISTYGIMGVHTTFDVFPTHLHAEKAVSLGLLINELITNACKYAFPDHDAPALTIRLTLQTDKGKREVAELMVADNGPGLPTDVLKEQHASFGMRLIKMQVLQLKGEYHFSTNSGTAFYLTFKI